MMTCGWETLRLPRLTDHIALSSISNGVNVGVSPEKHRARRETCKDQVLWTETYGRHTRDSCTPLPPASDGAPKQRHLLRTRGQLPGPAAERRRVRPGAEIAGMLCVADRLPSRILQTASKRGV